MKISILPGSHPDLDTLTAVMREKYPTAQDAIVVVFEPDGEGDETLQIEWSCNRQQMATAAARLLWIAAGGRSD